MKIVEVRPYQEHSLLIRLDDGTTGELDVSPWLQYEAFADLADRNQFEQIHNGGYFLEWSCDADLSIDTIVAHLKPTK